MAELDAADHIDLVFINYGPGCSPAPRFRDQRSFFPFVTFRVIFPDILQRRFGGITTGHCSQDINHIFIYHCLKMMHLHGCLSFCRPCIGQGIKNIHGINPPSSNKIKFPFVFDKSVFMPSGNITLCINGGPTVIR